MLWLTLGLLSIGLLLVYLEFILPGGVPATIGSLILLGSLVPFYVEFQSTQWTLFYLVIVLLLVGLTSVLALYHIKRSGKYNTLYLSSDQKGFLATSFDQSAIGKEGIALTPLRLSGHIQVDGVQHQAVAKNQFIDQGASIKVVGGRGGYLIVKRK